MSTCWWGSSIRTTYITNWPTIGSPTTAVFFSQLLLARGLDLQDKFSMLVGQTIVGPIPEAVPATGKAKR